MADYSGLLQQAGQQYNVDPKLLQAVLMAESNGNPNAVSPAGASGLMQLEPATAKAMGVTDINDPQQNINAGAKYLSQQLDKYGDPRLALAAYNAGPGNVDKYKGIPPFPETQNYVGKIMANYAGPQNDQSTQAAVSALGAPSPTNTVASYDPFEGLPAATGGKGATAQSYDPFEGLPSSGKTKSVSAPAPTAQSSSLLSNYPLNPATAIKAIVPIADTVASLPGSLISQGEYAVRRALGQNPQQAEQGAQNGLGSFLTNPFAKAVTGVEQLMGNTGYDAQNQPWYKNSAAQALERGLGSVIQKSSNAVSGATGLPQQDVANMMQTGLMAAPGLLREPIGSVSSAINPGVSSAENVVRGATSPAPTASDFGTAMEGRSLSGVGAAAANSNPYPVMLGEDSSRGVFPQIKPSNIGQDVPPQEQAVRASIANQIMGPNAGAVRTGVVTGNENLLRSEYGAAKSPIETPASVAMKGQLAREQNSLANFAEDRINATGADPNLINDEQRGNVINDAFQGPEGLNSYFQNAKQQIYNQARQESGDNPIQTTNVDDLLKDPMFLAEAERSGNSGTVNGISSIINLARETGFKDPLSGQQTSPGSVAAWDAVRKSNNADWSPNNARVIGAVNQAIDRDIASSAGSSAYKLGDALHGLQQNIMNAPGFKNIFGSPDANGISSGVSPENIPSKLNNLRIDQWNHIYNTLDSLSNGQIPGAPEGLPPIPDELQASAAAAKNEVLGSLAREVYQQGSSKAGTWNQNAVNKTLNSVVGQKILQTFPPDEITNFHTLNYGGQIMPGTHSYEGAAQQAARLNAPGFIEKYAPAAATMAGESLGHLTGIPGASIAGGFLGDRVGSKISGITATSRGLNQLKDLQQEWQNNSAKGLNLLR